MVSTISVNKSSGYSGGTTTPAGSSNTTEHHPVLEDYHGGLIMFSVLILILNIFAIVIYKRHEKIRRNCINILLVSLAVSDLIVGVVYLPLLIFCETHWRKYSKVESSFVSVCRANFLVQNLCNCSTVFHIVALTIEKYFAVLHPFQRINVSTPSTYRKVLILVWILSFTFSMIPLSWMYDDPLTPTWRYKFHIYACIQASIFLGLATLILFYCYVRMFYQIHVKLFAHTNTGRVQTKARSDRKTILVFLAFFLIFLLGWTPYFFFNLNTKHRSLVSPEVKDFLICLRYFGAVLNPLLYSFIKTDYKQAIATDFMNLCSGCPSPIRFQKLVQTSAIRRQHNTSKTATTNFSPQSHGDINLKTIKPIHHRQTSDISHEARLSSQSDDTGF